MLPIWEGTTNILVLDVLRSFAKDGTGPALLAELGARLEPAVSPAIAPWREAVAREVADLGHHLQALAALDQAGQTVHAKAWCDRALRLYQAVLLLEEAERGLQAGEGRGVLVLGSFMRQHLSPRTWRDTLAGTGVEAYGAIVRHERVSPDAAVAIVRDAMAALPR
ncbi:hypothetical protein D3C72_980010 [compost metagenome]